MLLGSNFILNQTREPFQFEIQPYIHNFSNFFWEKSPFQKVLIPDESPFDKLPETNGLSFEETFFNVWESSLA